MKEEIKVPSVGESITTGTLAAWLRQDGELVKEGEKLFELETDKALIEVPCPGTGVLKIEVPEGTDVEISQTVATLDKDASATAAVPQPEAPVKESQTPGTPPLSPAVRRVVAEHDLDPQAISGTGKAGRITKADALHAAEQLSPAEPAPTTTKPDTAPPVVADPPKSPASPALPAMSPSGPAPGERRTERVPMTKIRQRTAERLVQAKQNTAYLTTFNEIDMHQVVAIRSQYKDTFQKDHGIKIGFMSFFVKACCQALKAFPAVNAQIEDNDIVYHHYYDIGVAMSLERGLIVPVVRQADTLHFAEIEARIASLAQRARDKKLMPDELAGGTFTITNGGIFGSLLSTPIPSYPQCAILGMHTIKKRAVVVDDQIVVRPMMYVALTYDHRVIDGRDAVGFLAKVRDYIEEPEKLLLEL
jgi:2-oxoglutarate dehydrogenase E2 component (dihydrolipoamide succinyltransferase)